jgi:hypothetical protein
MVGSIIMLQFSKRRVDKFDQSTGCTANMGRTVLLFATLDATLENHQKKILYGYLRGRSPQTSEELVNFLWGRAVAAETTFLRSRAMLQFE